jgi:hypothetical protein
MIFAKIKGTKKHPSEHRILFSDGKDSEQFNFYRPPVMHEKTLFNPDKKLESSEWFYVKLSADQVSTMIKPYSENEQTSADLNTTIESDYMVIEVVYRVIDKTVIFTKITDGYKIRNKRLVKFYDLKEAQLVHEESSIEFSGKPDAYFDGVDKLYFKDFSKIRSLFSGIDIFYREATHDEKRNFLDNDLFEADDIAPDNIGTRDSSRIAMVMDDDAIGLADGSNLTKILEAARNYPEVDIEISNDDKIIMKDNKDLKRVLNLITSRYYISDITGKKMESYGSGALSKTPE